MFITMLTSYYGVPSFGIVKRYYEGGTYDVPDSLACRFMRSWYGQPAARNATDKEITAYMQAQEAARVAA